MSIPAELGYCLVKKGLGLTGGLASVPIRQVIRSMLCRVLAASAAVADDARRDKRARQKSQRLSSSNSGELAPQCGTRGFKVTSMIRTEAEPVMGI